MPPIHETASPPCIYYVWASLHVFIHFQYARAEIERCRQFLTHPGISVLKEARIAASSGRVTAMHDVTEGGLATALEELSVEVCGHGQKASAPWPHFEVDEITRLYRSKPIVRLYTNRNKRTLSLTESHVAEHMHLAIRTGSYF